jgi:LysM repeat protein
MPNDSGKMTTGPDQPNQHDPSGLLGKAENPIKAATEAITHIVKNTESLSQIAAHYQVDILAITSANSLTENSLIYPGLALVIPSKNVSETVIEPKEFHLAKPGESLYSIAQTYSMTVARLQQLNGLSDSAILFPGTTLRLVEAEVPEEEVSTLKLVRKAPVSCLVHGYHRVKFGDQISRIASLHGVSTQALLSANNLGWNAQIHEGQKLVVPISHGPYNCPNQVVLEPASLHTVNTFFEIAQGLELTDFTVIVALCLEMQKSGLTPNFGALNTGTELLQLLSEIADLETKSVKQAIAAIGFENLADGAALWEPSAWAWLREVKSK